MPKNANEIRVGANGTVRAAPRGTAEPADISVAFAAGWVDLGLCSGDGVKLKDGRTIVDIEVWQLFYPGRKIVSGKTFDVTFALRQFAGEQVEFGLNASVTEDAAGKYRIEPNAAEVLDIWALSVEWLDGAFKYRWIIPAGIISDDVEMNVSRTAATDLPIGFSVVGSDSALPWYAQTDDPSFARSTGA